MKRRFFRRSKTASVQSAQDVAVPRDAGDVRHLAVLRRARYGWRRLAPARAARAVRVWRCSWDVQDDLRPNGTTRPEIARAAVCNRSALWRTLASGLLDVDMKSPAAGLRPAEADLGGYRPSDKPRDLARLVRDVPKATEKGARRRPFPDPVMKPQLTSCRPCRPCRALRGRRRPSSACRPPLPRW
jgi:hypothetical protein